MNFDNFNNIEELLDYMGYEKVQNENYNCDENSNMNEEYLKWCSKLNLDIPGGFQHITPMEFVVIGEVIGDIMSGQLPYNVGNMISNLMILIGQIIETYGTQQMYYEIGPGKYFELTNKNSENSICNNNNYENLKKQLNLKVNNLSENKNLVESIKKLNLKIINIEYKLNRAINKINELENKKET